MTDYCTSSDVTANIKGLTVTSSSVISTSILSDIISQESAMMDQYLRPRYTLPVTDATSLLFLKKICIDLVVYRVTKILQPKVAAPIPEDAGQDISHVTAYREAMKMLKFIMEGKTTLPGEEEKGMNFFSSTAVDDDHCTEFEYCEKQW